MEMKERKIEFVDNEVVRIAFTTLLIRVKSVNERYGSLKKFVANFDCWGATNGKFLYASEMMEPATDLENYITQVLKPLGMRRNRDYVVTFEQMLWGVERHQDGPSVYLNRPIPELSGVNWLDSLITEEGHYVWYVEEQLKNERI